MADHQGLLVDVVDLLHVLLLLRGGVLRGGVGLALVPCSEGTVIRTIIRIGLIKVIQHLNTRHHPEHCHSSDNMIQMSVDLNN